MLAAFVTGLWSGTPQLRAFPAATPTRTAIASATPSRSAVPRPQRQTRVFAPNLPDEIDLERAVDAVVALRRNLAPDTRLYREHALIGRELATLVILGTSQSTAARISTGMTILETQPQAAAALAAALHKNNDRFALRSFASAGCDDIRVTRLKDFAEPLGPAIHERLAGLRPGLSTRLGAALRHAGAEIAAVPTPRKLILVFTDGEPSDIDVTNPAEIAEDARRAILVLRQDGIDVYGIITGGAAADRGSAIFGRNTIAVDHLDQLHADLNGSHFGLTQR